MLGGRRGASAETSDAQLDASEYRELFENAPVMIRRSRPDKLFDYFNAAWLRFTGRTPAEERGMGWAEGIHPEDYERCVQTYTGAFERREPFAMDYRLRTAAGTYRWVNERGMPFERGGTFAGYVSSCSDVEENKRREETRRIHSNELNHRSKNLLAVVQAIAFQTFRSQSDPAQATSAFFGRLQTMAQTHDMLSAERQSGAELGLLIRSVATPYGAEGEAYTLDGEPFWLPPKQAMAVALCLNELFTNALMHGALSVASGRVAISWAGSAEGQAVLHWSESGGPAAAVPPRRGLGLRLVETLARDGGGTVRFDFSSAGLDCSLAIRVAA